MPKVTLKGNIEIPEDDLREVLLELPNHIELTRKEKGCLVFRVEEDKNNPLRFHVYEEFVSEEAFKEHQARVKASHWGKVTANVKRNYTIESA